jgi:predicted Zn-dependent protease
MIILFDDTLNSEASIIKNIVEKVFGIKCKTKKEDFSELFEFKKNLGGYEIQITKKYKNKILLTEKNIFTYKSTSKEDDWVFGFATNQKQFIISVARLKTNSDKPSKVLKISKNKYKSRIEFIVIHELGHWLVKNQKHYKRFIYKNPKTEHKTDLGMHCSDNKCIMSEFVDIKDLDKHIKINYKNFFCKKCMSRGFGTLTR